MAELIACFEKFFFGTFGNFLAAIDEDDPIGMLNGRQTMRNDNLGDLSMELGDSQANFIFANRIERRCRFI